MDRASRAYLGSAIAIGGPLVVTSVILIVNDPWTYYPGLLYLGAIVLAGLFANRFAAALALVVSAAALWTIVTSPSFTLDMTPAQAAGVLVVFVPVGSAIVWLVTQRETQRELAQAQAARAEALFAEERDRAVLLQRRLLPKQLPDIPGLELASCYQPAEALVGGDWYDAFMVGDGLVVLSLGDVAGHGVRAAAATMQIRNSIRVLAAEGYGPAAILHRVNRSMNDQREDMWLTTALLLVLDPDSGNFRWARAGHCLPVLFRSERHESELCSEAWGPPLGIGLDHVYREARGALHGGDVLVLYTDGMIERRRETLDIGEQRIMSALTTWAEKVHGIDEVLGGVVAACLEANAPLRDDACALVVRRNRAAANAGGSRRAKSDCILSRRGTLNLASARTMTPKDGHGDTAGTGTSTRGSDSP
jgi:serine phosphatase RsbU (regulator of sigma subunit)